MGSVSADVKYVLAFGNGEAEDRSLEGFSPRDPEDFGFNAWIFIGTEDSDRGDRFDLVVCSPSWLPRELASGRWREPDTDRASGSVVLGLDVWYMPRWNRTEFQDGVRSVCARCSPGPDWGSVASRVCSDFG